MQEQEQIPYRWIISFAVAVFFIFLMLFRKHQSTYRMQRKKSECLKKQEINKNLIIVAVEILNFIVLFSKTYKQHYRNLRSADLNIVKRAWKYLTNEQPCYRQRFNRKSIQKFFSELKATKNVRLILCTRLQKQVCEQILQRLKIQNCFQKFSRIYSSGQFISAEEIDHDTGRVIIISANKQDQDRSMAQHHNLILDINGDEQSYLDEAILSDLRECLVRLAARGRVDTLHEDMHVLMHQKGIPIYDDEN